MRGMIKWKPFNTLIKPSDIKFIEKNFELIEKPIIMKDKIDEINEILIKCLNNDLIVTIKYFDKGLLYSISGKITKYKKEEKYILINNKRIYFKNIISAYL